MTSTLTEPSNIAHSCSVLVVDDERNIRRTLSMVLDGEGYQVVEAESAERALELLHLPEQPIDLAIFDLKLPGMSGLDALAQLRAPIYEDKVVDFILELANVTEKKVTREALLKDDEDEKTAA